MEKNACEAELKLYRCCRIDFGQLTVQIFYRKIAVIRGAGNLFQYFKTCTENALYVRLQVIGGRNQVGLGQRHL